MKKIVIEWKHLDVGGKTCKRCSETGKGIIEMVDDLRDECRSKGVEILLQETQLTAEEIDQSNSVLINGQPIEDILPQTRISQNSCCSCSNLIGHATTCRSLVHFEEEHEAIPSRLIREAVCHIARCC